MEMTLAKGGGHSNPYRVKGNPGCLSPKVVSIVTSPP